MLALGTAGRCTTRAPASWARWRASRNCRSQDLLEVVPAAGGRTVLVPLVDAFVSGIDEDARRIDVDLPDGLLDL